MLRIGTFLDRLRNFVSVEQLEFKKKSYFVFGTTYKTSKLKKKCLDNTFTGSISKKVFKQSEISREGKLLGHYCPAPLYLLCHLIFLA